MTQTNRAAQAYINTLEAMLMTCCDFIESRGLAEEYGKWLVSRKETEAKQP